MTTLAAPSQFEHQFARVVRRRRVVKLLRWTVPAVGSIIFAALTIPLLIAGLLPNAQFEGIRLEDDKLVVDQPRATGTLSDGGTYEMTAKSAKTKIINQDTIDLADMRAQMNFFDGEDLVATSAIGTYSLISSILTLTSQIELVSSQGDTGEIGNGVADLDGQVFNGDDGVLFQFANGSTLEAINMHYDGAKQYWKFERASLTIPPQSEQDDEQ